MITFKSIKISKVNIIFQTTKKATKTKTKNKVNESNISIILHIYKQNRE